MYQRTIKREIKFSGRGIHSGQNADVLLKPAPVNNGIVFFRSDISSCPPVSADVDNVVNTFRSTNLMVNDVEIRTVEHLLSAFSGLSINNVIVEVSGPEIPIMDGSSYFFVKSLSETGICEQKERAQEFFSCKEPLFLSHKASSLILLPFDGLKITYVINYDHPLLKTQMEEIELEPRTYIESISRARTYAFMHEVKYLLENNLAAGGNLDNALIIKEDGYSTDLIYHNEPVRHKILDLIGDISLLGRPVKGHILAIKSGHKLNTDFVRVLKKNL